MSDLIDWRLAGLFIAGGVMGGLGGVVLGRLLGKRKQTLGVIFASLVIITGVYVLARGFLMLNVV